MEKEKKTAVSIDDNTNIQESVNRLELEILKTIENNNEKVKEVQRELESILIERKAATDKIKSVDPVKAEIIPIIVAVSTAASIPEQNLSNNIESESIPLEPQIDKDLVVKGAIDKTIGTTNFPKVDIIDAPVITTPRVQIEEEIDRKTSTTHIDDVTINPTTTKVRKTVVIILSLSHWLFAFLFII